MKLIAIDLDGTLLRDDKTIPPDALDGLKRVSADGVPVVIASARPPRSIKPFYDQLGLSTPVVAYNGALVWQFSPPTALQHLPLDGAVVREITAAARHFMPQCLLNIEATDVWITDRVDDRYQTQTAKSFPPDRVEPIEQWHGEPATKVLVQGEPAALSHVKLYLMGLFAGKANVVSTDADCLQITRAGVDKARGVRVVAEGLGIGPESVLAVGDNDNDAEMLAAFGYSAAMGTGTALAKRSAKVVVGSNNGDGFVQALKYGGMM